jgi:hypothetical protein
MKLLLSLILVSSFFFVKDEKDKITKKIPRQDETEVNVTIEFDAGKLIMGTAASDLIFNGDFFYTKYTPEIEYYLDGNTGQLLLNMEGIFEKNSDKKGFSIESLDEIEENVWSLNFTDHIPLSFFINIGAAETEMELSGMKIKSFELHSGASNTNMSFSQVNPVKMKLMKIETGFSQFTATDLLNANFESMSFEGNIGDYELHFGGSLMHTVKVHLDMSLGKLLLLVPKDAPFRLECDRSIFSSLDVESAFEQYDERWYSLNYSENKSFIDFIIDAGVGGVSLRIIE